VGRVVFNRKAEPAVDWSEIESRLQDISNPSRSSSDVPIESSVTLANDPPVLIDQPASIDQPAPVAQPGTAERGRDSFDMLSLLAAFQSNRS